MSAVPSVTLPASTTPPKTATSSSSSSSTSATTTVDYNSFLQLLVQELKNQDPTAPSDPAQYLSQIASFSNVQQTAQTNTTLNTLLTTASLTQAEGVIGKTVTSADGTQSGRVTSVALASGGSATATLADGSTMTLDNTVTIGGGLSTAASGS